MAKLSAPKSADYDAVHSESKRRADIQALRKKTNWTQAERDSIIGMLMDAVLTDPVPPTP